MLVSPHWGAFLARIVPTSMNVWQFLWTITWWWLIVNKEQVKTYSIQSALNFIHNKIHKILYNVASVRDWRVRTQNVNLSQGQSWALGPSSEMGGEKQLHVVSAWAVQAAQETWGRDSIIYSHQITNSHV